MNRNSLPPLASHAHIDLLHGSRRIWKEEVDSFSLVNIEEKKIGFFREGRYSWSFSPNHLSRCCEKRTNRFIDESAKA